ncbi:chemotaxis protein CheB [Spirosoma utsteinense]|uniref:protein-glutamate methylesterase n=1 Tax=Spirosoma utsteinense TaxID=2585773 RepID=A0ABR6WCD0_9BACT|nr:chemotaxis protein CheB [Spirosoma utsteinense]MBC3785257.1 two-component system chemotaxis response regulator CheB [Spirosoma utsteinense]MBC3793939.1 two-component system chemotaxis response regulator CheB [Spirosoma utsteinense]
MAKRDIIVIGASAGGVYALKALAASLPADFKAAIFVVLHVSPSSPSFLPDILNHAGLLKASHPQDGELIRQGHIYVASPDHHLLVEDDKVVVKKGPKENRFRPSIDALFRSVAYSYGPRVIGVVLTGLLDDGTSGMWSVKRLGGLGVVQEPEDAMYASMPDSVLQYVDVDYQVPITDLASLLCQLIEETVPDKVHLADKERVRIETEVSIAAQANAFELGVLGIGHLTALTCPECSGALISIQEGKLTRYRCHTGHAYTANSLLVDVTKTVEESLWKSVRSLEEMVILLEQSARKYAESNDERASEQFYEKARETRERAATTRELIFKQERLSHDIATTKDQLTIP